MGELIQEIWQQCPLCDGEFIVDAKLEGDTLVVLCDGCGETLRVPFSSEDILGYIRTAIYQRLEEDAI